MRDFTRRSFRFVGELLRDVLGLAIAQGVAMILLWLCSPGGRQTLARLAQRFRKQENKFNP